jgi:hypothetical protein
MKWFRTGALFVSCTVAASPWQPRAGTHWCHGFDCSSRAVVNIDAVEASIEDWVATRMECHVKSKSAENHLGSAPSILGVRWTDRSCMRDRL